MAEFHWDAEWFFYIGSDGRDTLLRAQAIEQRLADASMHPQLAIGWKSGATGYIAAARLARLYASTASRASLECAFTTKETAGEVEETGRYRKKLAEANFSKESLPHARLDDAFNWARELFSLVDGNGMEASTHARDVRRSVADGSLHPKQDVVFESRSPESASSPRVPTSTRPVINVRSSDTAPPPRNRTGPLAAGQLPLRSSAIISGNSRFAPLWKWTELRKLGERDAHQALARDWAAYRLAHPEEWVLIDTETTGLGGSAQVIEIAVGAIHFLQPGKPIVKSLFHQRLRPTVPIQWDATQIHGITESMLRSCPSYEDISDQLTSLLRQKTLVAWNASFDAAMLLRTASAFKVQAPFEKTAWQCAMRAHAVWRAEPGNRRLYRQHKLGGNHSAFGDIEAMAAKISEMANNPPR